VGESEVCNQESSSSPRVYKQQLEKGQKINVLVLQANFLSQLLNSAVVAGKKPQTARTKTGMAEYPWSFISKSRERARANP
jgi:hypothetical protein